MSRLKRVLFWQITLLPTYMLGGVALVFAAGYEAVNHGPYAAWFNQALKRKAEGALLVGSPAHRVEAILGQADNIREFWEVLDTAGRPAREAEFVTTYEYYPYPWIPYSKVQVHCTRGVVRVVEMFDD